MKIVGNAPSAMVPAEDTLMKSRLVMPFAAFSFIASSFSMVETFKDAVTARHTFRPCPTAGCAVHEQQCKSLLPGIPNPMEASYRGIFRGIAFLCIPSLGFFKRTSFFQAKIASSEWGGRYGFLRFLPMGKDGDDMIFIPVRAIKEKVSFVNRNDYPFWEEMGYGPSQYAEYVYKK